VLLLAAARSAALLGQVIAALQFFQFLLQIHSGDYS
jgi:hypothetical protein